MICAFADSLSCFAILYLIHQFGPYKQYLRHAELISGSDANTRYSFMTATRSQEPSSKQTLVSVANQRNLDDLKRVSGITDIKQKNTLVGGM